MALVLVILLALIYGLLEMSRLMMINAEIESAAREGAQFASLRPNDAAGIAARARSRLFLADEAAVTVVGPTFPRGGLCISCPVEVSVSYQWRTLVPILPDSGTLVGMGPINLSSKSTKLIERIGP
jgi:Flp pilus assembly protein TadG